MHIVYHKPTMWFQKRVILKMRRTKDKLKNVDNKREGRETLRWIGMWDETRN